MACQGQPEHKTKDISYRHDDPKNGPPRPLIRRCTPQIEGLAPAPQPTPINPTPHTSHVPPHSGIAATTGGNSNELGPQPGDVSHQEGEGNADPGSVQERLPGGDWREQHGAAGVQADKRRSSPIVELSLLLVSAANCAPCRKWCTCHPTLGVKVLTNRVILSPTTEGRLLRF